MTSTSMKFRTPAVAAVVGAVVLFTLTVMGAFGRGYATRVIDDVGLLGSALVAAGCCLRAATGTRRRERFTWLAIGSGLGGWAFGEAVWCYFELVRGVPQAPFPSIGDAGFLSLPLGLAVALAMFPGGRNGRTHTGLLDGVIVAGSMFVVSWVTVLANVYRAGAASHVALIVSLAYPTGDLVVVTMTVLLLIRAHATQRATLALLAIGVGLVSLSDSVFVYLTALDAYRTGSPIDLGWFLGFLCFAAAAQASRDEATTVDRALLVARARIWLPYLPMAIAALVAFPRLVPAIVSGPIPAVAFVVVAALVVRQFVTVAENQRLLVTVAHQAFHDPLTGLANRALFTDRLDHALSLQARDHREVSVLCIDLDDFKQVNDSLGHSAGDELLIKVAERLTGCVRTADTVARMGGDEFAILIEHGDNAPARLADRITAVFTPSFMVDDQALEVRASIGVASASSGNDTSAASLLKQADSAMYQTKREHHDPRTTAGSAADGTPPRSRTAVTSGTAMNRL